MARLECKQTRVLRPTDIRSVSCQIYSALMIEGMEFPGESKKEHMEIPAVQESVKRELEYPGVLKKNSCGISTSLDF